VKVAQDYYAPILGELEHLVMLALFRHGNGAYGVQLLREIRERTGREVAPSAMYVTLQRLEEKQMVVSYVGAPTAQRGGRRRKHYLLDTLGERALGRAYRTFRSMAEGVEEGLAAL
jgi:DNA-binding PadR family transcriptional regulator